MNKYLLNLAGEYGASSELAKRGIIVNITLGNLKSVDLIIFSTDKSNCTKIEVKTTNKNKFVTGFFQKYESEEQIGPDYWILVYINSNFVSRYFILTHREMAEIQMKRNNMNKWTKIVGVDNVLVSSVLDHENRWDKILNNTK